MTSSFDRERIRQEFRPERTRLLFVGESPPASGRFFYFGAGIVFASTQRAFAKAFRTSFASPEEFFCLFQRTGCYLDDVSHKPVDDLARFERKRAIDGCIDTFAQRLRDMKPEAIVIILKKIETAVATAASLADIPHERLTVLPFPGNGHQKRYVDQLVAFLEQRK